MCATNCYFEIHEFFSECAHFVVEAESVLPNLTSCKDKVSLTLPLALHNHLFVRAYNFVVNIE